MDFPKNVGIDACEKFLTKLEAAGNDESLHVPVGTTRYAFGGLASAVQAANTWVRLSGNRQLILRSSRAKDEIRGVIVRPHKFVAAMSARSITVNENRDIELRPQVNAEARLAIERQVKNQFGQQRGGLCWFAFVDHSSKGFDRNFYIEKSGTNPEPRQAEQFSAVIGSMVDKAMGVAGGARALDRQSLDHLGRIFYELFLNTHEHGTRNKTRSEWLKPGTRIIYVQAINLSETGARNATEEQPMLSSYLAAVSKRNRHDCQRRFVEIGIVDSGLGYCGRWIADNGLAGDTTDLSIEEEYGIFKKCFGFRQTSTFKYAKGIGLPVVMDRLTKLGGFMRVRSGRLAMYRNFVASPFTSDDDCVFSDWDSGESAERTLTTMSSTAGVAISLLIPLEGK